ncbi:energy transducer TonB [Sulfuricurvum sp.]|uniref:energy transducer TonB n=1 Tax=Sulfuricurvum sp. TaxID=2025608 RepID=UPI001998411F|nr:energy transducer TonB [Sulfuricurvum sp.]MBD3806617.1 energy transducer TonB [Sulfuricurvum sp.]
MKKSFLLSLIIHMAILSIVVVLTVFIPYEKKVEPIKIKIMILQQKPMPSEIPVFFKPTPPKNVEASLDIPKAPVSAIAPVIQPIPKLTPIVTTPITPAAPLPVQKSVEAPVQKTPETLVVKAVAPKVPSIEPIKTDPKAKENYIAHIRQLIDERKVYPKNAKRLKQMGTVIVRFKVVDDGTITNVSVIDSSGFELLDQSAKELLYNIGRFRAIPEELGSEPIDLTLPIEYMLR